MNPIAFGNATCKRAGSVSGEARPEGALDTAWLVLEAANDFGDGATVDICRRVIDANLNGAPALSSDLHVIFEYFR
jgi:hypothetical protein